MAGSKRGFWARLVDWFTIEVEEPVLDELDQDGRTAWEEAAAAAEYLPPAASIAPPVPAGPPPAASPAPRPAAGRRRGLVERAFDWMAAEDPEPAGQRGHAAATAGRVAAAPARDRRAPADTAVAAFALMLGSLVELGSVVRAHAASVLHPSRRPRAAGRASASGRLREGWLAGTGAIGSAIAGTAAVRTQRPPAAPRQAPTRRSVAAPPAASRRFVGGRLVVLLAALAVAGLGVRLAVGGHAVADGPAVPTARDIAVARAQVAAAASASAAQDAQAAGGRIRTQLATAQRAAQQVASLATPALARQPSAQDPSGPLATLQLLQSQAAATVTAIGHDVSTAEGGVAAAASDPLAAKQAAAAAATAKAALAAAQGGASQIAALVPPAQRAAATWRQIHTAPPGTLGVTTQDPPAGWGVRGCEVRTVAPGGAGQRLGLVGAAGFLHPVGDVITLVRDTTDGNASWPVASCAALQAAMAQSRAGDRITVSYEQRATVDLVLGFWLSHTGTVVLGQGGAAQSVCPGPLTGRTGPGGTVPLTVAVSGPAGTRPGVAVTIDPAGGISYFPDALLRALGYRPYQSESGSGVLPGSKATVNLYNVPGSSLTVQDHGQAVPLADGILSVVGVPGGSGSVVGAAVLSQGAQLTVSGGTWSLTPPCH